MRQAGVVAAAGLYALDHNVERLADDHANARRLAEGLAEAGLPVDPDEVETNFVLLDAFALGYGARGRGPPAGGGGAAPPAGRRGCLRAVTHLDVTPRSDRAGDRGRHRALAPTREVCRYRWYSDGVRAAWRPCVFACSSSFTSQRVPEIAHRVDDRQERVTLGRQLVLHPAVGTPDSSAARRCPGARACRGARTAFWG